MIADWFHDAHVWVALSFVIFAIVAFILGRKPVLARLDGRIAHARKEIETAEQLRAEAQALLDTYTRRQQDAQAEAERVIAEARRHAEEIQRHGMRELEETMQRREKLLTDRLTRMKDDAVHEIQAYAAGLIVKATSGIIESHMDEATSTRLSDQSAAQLAGRL